MCWEMWNDNGMGVESMTLMQLKYFQTVCKLGSISRASLVLNITQPAISSAIKELEREYSVQLFERVGKRLILTQEGSYLLTLADDFLLHADNLGSAMSDLSNQRNHIMLGISPMLASIFLPSIVNRFAWEHPEVELKLFEDGRYNLFEKLYKHELDMIILSDVTKYTDPLQHDYHSIQIADLEFGYCVARDHPLAKAKCIHPNDIAQEALLAFTDAFQQPSIIERWFADAGLQPRFVYRTNQLSTIYEMILTCKMSSLIYRNLEVQKPELCFIPLEPAIRLPINLFWRVDGRLYSHMSNMIQCVTNVCNML